MSADSGSHLQANNTQKETGRQDKVTGSRCRQAEANFSLSTKVAPKKPAPYRALIIVLRLAPRGRWTVYPFGPFSPSGGAHDVAVVLGAHDGAVGSVAVVVITDGVGDGAGIAGAVKVQGLCCLICVISTTSHPGVLLAMPNNAHKPFARFRR